MSMNVVHSGTTFQIYGDALKTYDALSLGTYDVCFHKMMGFFLTSRNDLVVNEEKIYGSTPIKVDKVLRSFSAVDRNFGVILSGRKGIGKSLFARQLATKAKDYNLPLLVVSSYTPGIAEFLMSIEQEVIVLFDEFEKTFASTDDMHPQEEMLSLFDGLDNGKKLFVVTCNEVAKLNSYLLNRPGRFHYHFILGNPNPEEIREYMMDKLKPEYHSIISKVVNFSITIDLTYDILRAIAFELNNGYSFEETIMDLNIGKESTPYYNINIKMSDGKVITVKSENINTYSTERKYIWGYLPGMSREYCLRFDFLSSDVSMDIDRGEMTIDPSLVNIYVCDSYDYDEANDERKAVYDYLKSLTIERMSFVRENRDFVYKYVI